MPKQTPLTVKVSRRFNTSPENLFDAWLDPQRARQFLFTRPGQVVVRAEIDAQVGGSFLYVARRDGRDIDHVGEYLEIHRPRRLVFTLCVPTAWTDRNRVTVEFTPCQAGCELTVTHEGVLPQHESSILSGWTQFLEHLQTQTESASRRASMEIWHEILIHASASELYQGLTDVKKLSHWWTTDVRGQSAVGQTLEFWFSGFRASVMEVKTLQPAELVQWHVVDGGAKDWTGTQIEFKIFSEQGKTMLHFRHSNWREVAKSFPHCSMGWAIFLLSLKEFMETGKGRPIPTTCPSIYGSRWRKFRRIRE